jgi:hypothetical protein
VALGWRGVFVTLAVVSAAAALCAGYLLLMNSRAAAVASQPALEATPRG